MTSPTSSTAPTTSKSVQDGAFADGGTVHCFVFTPLAYLCALEYVRTYPVDRSQLYVISTNDHTLSQVKSLVKPADWSSIDYLSGTIPAFLPDTLGSAIELVRLRISLQRVLQAIAPGDGVLVSHIDNPYSRLIIERARRLNIRVTVVDDGTATIEEFAKLEEFGVIDRKNEALRSQGRKARIEEKLFSTSPVKSADVQFFSFWPLPGREDGSRPVVLSRNQLSVIRTQIRNQPDIDEVFFVGQPLVRRGVIDEAEYHALLRRLAAHYRERGLEFRYFPHRNESLRDGDFDFRIVRNDKPFEIYLAQGAGLPRVIGGFFSSTLATTFHFFHDRIGIELYWGHQEVSPNNDITPYVAKMFENIAASADNFSINRTRL